jgi:preprotein translocase subunit SecD
MKSLTVGFNIILLILISLSFVSCSSNPKEKADKAEKKRKKELEKQATHLTFHLEVNPDGTPYNGKVWVYRAKPILFNVETYPVLDETHMRKVELVTVDEFGGFAIKITFNKRGTQFLDNVTTQNKGRHLAIFCRWTEERWLAAPRINRRISEGTFVFTPDATKDEAERIVAGLNNFLKKLNQPYTIGGSKEE